MAQNDLRVGVYLEGKLAQAMRQEKGKTLAAYAAIARAALVEYFQARGYDVEDTVAWGGPRPQSGEEQETPGQLVGLEAA